MRWMRAERDDAADMALPGSYRSVETCPWVIAAINALRWMRTSPKRMMAPNTIPFA